MSDQYPEVTVDESGLVPPQGGRGGEWPKKIRTLTAAELDRLTIDADGRFFWDGKAISFDGPSSRPEGRSTDPLDRSALELMDRAAMELHDPGSVRHEKVDIDAIVAQVTAKLGESGATDPMLYAPRVRSASDRVRVSLSAGQSLALFVLVIGVLLSASGIAAYGLAMAHDWSCRVGLIQNYCVGGGRDIPA